MKNQLKLYLRLWDHLEYSQKKNFTILLCLMIFVSIFEILSLGAIAPFLSILSAKELISYGGFLKEFIYIFEITTKDKLTIYATLFFCLTSIVVSLLRYYLFKKITFLSFITGAELGQKIYFRTLQQPYLTHSKRNSSEVISAITAKTSSLIYQAIMPILSLISGTLILLSLSLAIFYAYPVVALIFGIVYLFIYLLITKYSRYYLLKNSELVSRSQGEVIKALQEGLGGIRDVIIDGSQKIYAEVFEKSNYRLQESLSKIHFLGGVPRFIIEPISVVIISLLAIYLSYGENGLLDALPTLAILAYAAQRMLPLFQNLFGAWAAMTGGIESVSDAITLLDQKVKILTGQTPINFESFENIQLVNCSFYYEPSKFIIKNINLNIKRGEIIGFYGKSGSGKSTILDILMGLISPVEGHFLVDNITISNQNLEGFQKLIGHVSQNIFLLDSSILQNIAFGINENEIDLSRVKIASDAASLTDTINLLPNKYFSRVGERGVMLSGGQIQRIGIARALYKQIKILVLDEATSALDESTEETVIRTLCNELPDVTIIMVSHQKKSLRYCDRLIEIVDGKLQEIEFT
jgi:ABC-type multidrug transport system fused ATPase/permease subunit